MDPAVQQQMHDAFAAVEKLRGSKTPALGAAYGAMGNLLFAGDYVDAAENCYVNAALLDPGEPRWPYYLGHVYRVKGDAPKSVAAFERALALKPDQVATMVWLGNAYLDQNRPADAEAQFARARAIDARSAAALFGLGRAALATHRYREAADLLEQALAADPRATVVHYPLAMAYRGLGQADKAELHLRQRGTVDVGPDDPWLHEVTDLLQGAVAYENRGVRALDAGQWAEAAANFRKAIALQPDRSSLHHQLGTALAMTGDPRGAFAEFQEAVRLDPASAKAHFSLGVLLAPNPAAQSQAIAELAAAVHADPSYVEARVQLAGLYRRAGRLPDALSEFDQALALDPRAVDAQLGYAVTLAGLKRYREARDRLLDAARARPDVPAFGQALVRVLAASPDERIRDGREALALGQALVSDPRAAGNPDVAEAMAMALAEAGQYDEAARWQRQAIAGAERAKRPDLARQMMDNLELYERHQPCRTPWRDR
jgi:tetratricopeptide (TPR) repeat protein